jgi:hypothetical protein
MWKCVCASTEALQQQSTSVVELSSLSSHAPLSVSALESETGDPARQQNVAARRLSALLETTLRSVHRGFFIMEHALQVRLLLTSFSVRIFPLSNTASFL